MSSVLAVWMLPSLFALLFAGIPVAFAMMGVAVVFGWGVFGPAILPQLVEKIADVAGNFVLAAVALFVFMGTMLERSGIAERLFEAIHIWTRRLPGGLAIGAVVMCIIFAAATGIVGATETLIGLLAIPIMLRNHYDKPLICGTICAGGSLGTIIPPSVIAVVMGPLANVSVGDLLMGMVFPGLIMGVSYIVYIYVLCRLRPEAGPADLSPETRPLSERLWITMTALVPPALMILAVLGSIMFAIAAPTEAAAIGAAGSVVLTICYGRFTWQVLAESLMKTLTITSMIMTILLAGSMMTGVFIAAGGVALVQGAVETLGLGRWGVLAVVLGIAFLAGFILDWISIVLLMIPLFAPIMKTLGFDLVWFCTLFLIILQTSYLTPPMAPAIFYLRGIAPQEITTMDMYKGVIPFIMLQLATLAITIAFPAIVTWLPSVMLGFN